MAATENKAAAAMARSVRNDPQPATGWDDETQDGTPVYWREYAITREQYMGGQKTTSTNDYGFFQKPT